MRKFARLLLRKTGLLHVIDNISNLIYWFPVIWRDQPWDYDFLFRIMRHKIAQMSASTKDWLTVSAEDKKLEMDQVIGILDDLINTTHEDKAYGQHRAIFGESKWIRVPYEGNDKLMRVDIVYPDIEDQELATRGLVALASMAAYARQISLEALGRAMTRIEGWWD